MATLSHSESSRLYSWWWDSHISPKNSKWLQDNLTDMDAKVKSMIKLIEEDADSFARRAEMYYKKRPELIKLVEEFYRAYRALAERYDYATGELRQAHQTMEKAFPDQVPFVLVDESPSRPANLTDSHMPEIPPVSSSFLNMDDLNRNALIFLASDQHSFQAFQFHSEDSDVITSKQGMQQHDPIFCTGVVPCNVKSAEGSLQKGLQHKVSKLLNENQELNAKFLSESERAGKAESEVQYLKKALTDMQAVKEAVQSQYQQNVIKLSSLEGELLSAEMDSKKLSEQASKADSELSSLKEAIVKVEAERDAVSDKNKDFLERISNLEVTILHAQEDAKELKEQSLKAEVETQISKKELSRLEAEKEAGLLQYKQCLEKISDLEKKVFIAEGDARHLKQQAEVAETEVVKLKVILAEVTAQKEATALQYKVCLEKISNLESEISRAQGEIRCLKNEILGEATKLRIAEDKCDMLEMSNRTLRLEADNLFKKIALKDKELTEKHGDLEKLQVCLQDERSRHAHVEATLVKLQNMHCQSQEEQRNLILELKNGLEMLKDINLCKHGLEEDIRQIKDENCSLKEQNSSSTMSMKDLQNEIVGLTMMKERFDEEVEMQLGQSNALQKEISCLKEEIVYLNRNYQTLVKQVEMVGLDPKCLDTSVRKLQDENSQLKQINEKDKDEKETLYEKLVSMVELLEKNAALQSSLTDVTSDLEGSQKQAKVLQESFNILHGEKCALVAEKDSLISQLKLITKTMQELSEKNNALESLLGSANSELQSLREKSKNLEELCQFLSDEKANLLYERSTLAAQLDIVERKIINLEKRFTEFEGNYSGIKMAKESPHFPLDDLMVSLKVGKHEHESLKQLTESRLASLEERICLLQEESRQSKKDFQDEFEKSVVSQFEIYILQKFVTDMEEKNYLLLTECQKQIEASKLADQLISELENENLEQQVEEEYMLVEIDKLRSGLHQIRKALENGSNSGSKNVLENDHISVHHILEDIAIMNHSLLKYNDDMQRLAIENSVFLTIFGQLRLEGLEVESEKKSMDQDSITMSDQYLIMQSEWHKLLEINRKIKSVTMGNHHAKVLNAEVQNLTIKQAEMQSSYLGDYSQTFKGNRSLSKSFSDTVQNIHRVDAEDNAVIKDTLTCANLSTIFSSLRIKNAGELKQLSENVSKLFEVNCELVNEVSTLREELGMHEIEKLFMADVLEKLEMDISELKNLNCRLKLELLSANDYLSEGEEELFDAEMKLVVVENLNSELRKAVDRLKKECKESESVRENLEILIQNMTEDISKQTKNLQDMIEVKGNLESELTMLSKEIKERRTREEYLKSELQEKQSEYELWDAEAATFCFDLQLSAIRELLYEDKVHELCGVCGSLQDENALKTKEIELLKEKVSFQSGEIRGLKSQLFPFSPAIHSLKEEVDSLEHNFLPWEKLDVAHYQTPKDMELEFHSHEKVENQDSQVLDEILELQKLQNRIKEVEKVVMEEMNRLKRKGSLGSNIKLEAAVQDIADLKSRCKTVRQKSKRKEEGTLEDDFTFQKTMPEILEVKNVILMKGIPLDQVSAGSLYGRSRRGNSLPAEQICWETNEDNHRVDQNLIELQNQVYEPTKNFVYNEFEYVEQQSENPSSELDMEKELGVDKLQVSTATSISNRGGNKKKILERLASDGQKLANIQTNVQDLRRKLETNKKNRNTKNVDLETVKEQLLEAEETTIQLINLNGQMTRKIEDIPVFKDGQRSMDLEKAASFQKKKVSEQARKESEKIGRLQLEIQKIHYALLQLEDKKKNKVINKFSRTKSRTTVILRDFIHSGRRSSVRKKKSRLCGCFKPSSTNAGGNM